MQTFVHANCGIPIGLAVAYSSSTSEYEFAAYSLLFVPAAIMGSAAPDVPAAFQLFRDELHGKKNLFESCSSADVLWINIFHGTPVWLLLLWQSLAADATLGFKLFLAVAIGGLLHTAIDQVTHGYPETGFNQPRQHFWWPLPTGWGLKIFALTAQLTRGWDYRINPGQLWPLREPEKWTVAGALALSTSLILRGLNL